MKKFVLVALAMGLATAAVPANAAITVGYSTNGGATITQIGNDGGTGNYAVSGAATGSFTTSVLATGSPVLAQPSLESSSINVSSGAAGNLLIYVTQTGLSAFNGGLLSSFTSNLLTGAATSVTESTYVDYTDALFGMGTPLGTATFSTISTATSTNPVSAGGLFSETEVYSLTFGGAGTFNDTINMSAVPEPSTWGLMLLGFAGMGLVMRRRKQAIAQVA